MTERGLYVITKVIMFSELFDFILSSILSLIESSLLQKNSGFPWKILTVIEGIMQEPVEIINNSTPDFKYHCKDDIFLRKCLQVLCLIQGVKAFVSGETFRK